LNDWELMKTSNEDSIKVNKLLLPPPSFLNINANVELRGHLENVIPRTNLHGISQGRIYVDETRVEDETCW